MHIVVSTVEHEGTPRSSRRGQTALLSHLSKPIVEYCRGKIRMANQLKGVRLLSAGEDVCAGELKLFRRSIAINGSSSTTRIDRPDRGRF
jgi:hypothetical protein